MRRSVNRAEVLRRLAREEGFGLAGIAAPDPSQHSALLDLWIREGWAGTMAYMARPANLARRGDLRRIMPEVRSVLVVGQNYFREDPGGVPADPARGVIARYARGRDYHRVIAGALRRVHRRFEEAEGRRVPGRVYVDTGPVLERELAERAGLGWFGRNTLMIHPRRGSYFFLGILLLALEVEPDAPLRADHCGSCRACLDACPTSALLGRRADGAPVMDASRCISYLTIEHRGPIPHELRPRIGNRIYGCDICQEVCPFNVRFARPAAEPGYAPRGPGELPPGVEPLAGPDPGARHPGTDGPPLTELMRMDRASWEAFSRGSPIRRAGRAGFLRNVAVALGNWGSGAAVPALRSALGDTEPLVRGHAAWGLGRIGSAEAVRALRTALAGEGDAWVRGEIARALRKDGAAPAASA